MSAPTARVPVPRTGSAQVDQAVLEVIVRFTSLHGYPPTLREIAAATG